MKDKDQQALEAALEPFETDEQETRLDRAVEKALQPLLAQTDLTKVSQYELDSTDAVALARGNYVLSLLRVAQFLRRGAKSVTEKAAQAKVALQFVRMCDARYLASLQMGRNQQDGHLADEVASLRNKLNQIANWRAKASKKNGKTDPRTASG